MQDNGAGLELGALPNKALESTSEHERRAVAEVVGELAKWDGFAASVATKVLRKKRSGLIPILDNQAIFGAYMNPGWPPQLEQIEPTRSRVELFDMVWWMYFRQVEPVMLQKAPI